MKTWYRLARATVTGGSAELLIYDEIGLWGIDAQWLVQDLMDIGNDDLLVRVNSPGGDIFEGIAIMNALRAHRGTVTAVVEGLAASAASVIAVGGADRLVMRPQAELMIHDAWSLAAGNADDMTASAEQLNRTSDSMAAVYADKAGGTVEEWRQAMRDETWMSADEAVESGLADAVEDAREEDVPDVVAAHKGKIFALARKFNHTRRAEAPRPAIIDPAPAAGKETDMPLMQEVATRLGLKVEDLDEKTILAALDEVLDEQDSGDPAPEATEETGKAPTPKPTTDKAGDEEGEPQPDDDETTDEDSDTVVHLDKAVYEDLLERAAAGDSAAEESKAERAAALIDKDGIKAGRLLGWQRDAWIAQAIDDFDQTKASLMKLSPGTIPLVESGRGGSDDDVLNKTSKAMSASAKKSGFAPAPTI